MFNVIGLIGSLNQSKLVFVEYKVTQVLAAEKSATPKSVNPVNLPPVNCNHLLSEPFSICSRYVIKEIVATVDC